MTVLYSSAKQVLLHAARHAESEARRQQEYASDKLREAADHLATADDLRSRAMSCLAAAKSL